MKKSVRANSLTEIAIVLGVIGVVLGGIWVAYSAVSQNKKVEKGIEELRYIVTGIQQKYSVNPGILAVPFATFCYVTVIACPSNPPSCVGSGTCSSHQPLCNGVPCGVIGAQRYTGCPVGCSPPPNCYGGIWLGTDTGSYVTSNTSPGSGLSSPAAALANAGIFPSEMISINSRNGNYMFSSPWGTNDVQLSLAETSNFCSVMNSADQASMATIRSTAQTSATTACSTGSPTSCSSQGRINSGPGHATTAPIQYMINGSDGFTLAYSNMPVAICIRLIGGYGTELTKMNLSGLTIAMTGVLPLGYITPSYSPSTANVANASAWCSGADTSTVNVTFNFSFYPK